MIFGIIKTNTMTPNPILTTNPTQGETLSIAGGSYRIVMSGKQTDGEFAVIEMTVPPNAGPNPHSHADITESFYVLEGSLTFKSQTGTFVAEKGAFITIPKGGMIHGFKNLNDTPAKLLCTVYPAGLDEFFHEAAALTPTTENRMEKITALSKKYGQVLYPEGYLD